MLLTLPCFLSLLVIRSSWPQKTCHLHAGDEAYESAEIYVTVTRLMLAQFSTPTISPYKVDRWRTASRDSKRTIVASHKCITVAASHLAIHELSCALECDVHVAINRLKLAYAILIISPCDLSIRSRPEHLPEEQYAYPCRQRQSSTSLSQVLR